MVLTINRGYLCLHHPPVIISTDLIFLFSFSSPQSGAGKTWLQNGDIIAAVAESDDRGHGHLYLKITGWPHITRRCLTMWICFFFVRSVHKNKQFGQKWLIWVFYWPTALHMFRQWHYLRINVLLMHFISVCFTFLCVVPLLLNPTYRFCHLTWRNYIAITRALLKIVSFNDEWIHHNCLQTTDKPLAKRYWCLFEWALKFSVFVT